MPSGYTPAAAWAGGARLLPGRYDWQVGYIISPDMVLQFVTTIECPALRDDQLLRDVRDFARAMRNAQVRQIVVVHTTSLPSQATHDAQRRLIRVTSLIQPPAGLVRLFNDHNNNGFGADARMAQLYRRVMVSRSGGRGVKEQAVRLTSICHRLKHWT